LSATLAASAVAFLTGALFERIQDAPIERALVAEAQRTGRPLPVGSVFASFYGRPLTSVWTLIVIGVLLLALAFVALRVRSPYGLSVVAAGTLILAVADAREVSRHDRIGDGSLVMTAGIMLALHLTAVVLALNLVSRERPHLEI